MPPDSPNTKPKLKLAIYWGAACGGCCVSVLDTHEKLLDIVAAADLVFWPIAMDIKYKDVEALPDKSIDVTLFNGAVRNSENKHMAQVLRNKSKILVAYGACAYMGGIPGLAKSRKGCWISRRCSTMFIPLTRLWKLIILFPDVRPRVNVFSKFSAPSHQARSYPRKARL